MESYPVFFRDFAYVFVAALVGGLLARRLRQPLILGYVLGGILIGPFTPGPTVSDIHVLEMLAELGVILLMYSIGIEFSARDLMRVKWVAVLGGPTGILLSILLAVAAGSVMGWTVPQGITIGAIVCVASTMVLARLLLDSGQLHTEHGRVMIGITLVEDMAVVVLTIVLPAIGAAKDGTALLVAKALGRAVIVLVPLAFLATKIVPPIMTRVARTRSRELFLLVALTIGFATAAVTQAAGLSLALGAFLAGVVVSESVFAQETLAQLLPMRDAFVALFFVTIGALISPAALLSNLPLLAVMVALIIFGKLLIWTAVVTLFRYSVWTGVVVGVGLTQIGEFSFILAQVGRKAGLVGDDVYNATLAAALLTIVSNAFLVRFVPGWMGGVRLAQQAKSLPKPALEPGELHNHVVICGFGRVGSALGTALETFGVPYVVVEIDPDIVTNLRARRVPCIFGDPVHSNILQEAGVERSQLVVITLPERERAAMAIRKVRSTNPKAPLLARAHQAADREELLEAGATEVIQPEVEASATLIRNALDYLKVPENKSFAYVDTFREAMESGKRRRPSVPALMPVVQDIELNSGAQAGQSLEEAHVRERFGVTVVAVSRDSGETIVNPPAQTRLYQGDKLRVFGLPEQIKRFTKHLSGGEQ
jgi:CPA2 family monovalent cation:H+ antiporter-2